jgi:hypothetical protein
MLDILQSIDDTCYVTNKQIQTIKTGGATMNTKEKRLEQRKTFISGRKTEHHNNLEILKHEKNGRFCLVVWRGSSSKPFANYYFNTEQIREDYLSSIKKRSDERAEYDKEQKEKRKIAQIETIKNNSIKRGDLFYTSWGYDQTNYDYIAVLSVSHTGKTAKCQCTEYFNEGTRLQEDIQTPLFCPYGDIFTMQIREGNTLVGSYPFCNGSMNNSRLGRFSRVAPNARFYETNHMFGH